MLVNDVFNELIKLSTTLLCCFNTTEGFIYSSNLFNNGCLLDSDTTRKPRVVCYCG